MKISSYRFTVLATALVLALGTLSACGIKPGSVSPPNTEKPDNFPKTYPQY